MEYKNIKDIFREFLKNELKEIKQNNVRFAALIAALLFSLVLLVTGDDSEEIDLNEPVQIEQIEEEKSVSTKDKKSDTDKKIIVVKKNQDESEGKKISVVIGANSDELYIRDPFAVEEEPDEKVDVALKAEVEKIPVTPPKIPEIPAMAPVIPDNLPPIPESNIPLNIPPIPQQQPIIPIETKKSPAEEFLLAGTIICDTNKNAIVRKISQNANEEDRMVEVGDFLGGQRITDITGNALVLNNGENYIYLSGFGSSDMISDSTEDTLTGGESLNLNSDNEEFENIPIEYQENVLFEQQNSDIEEDIDKIDEIQEVLLENENTVLNNTDTSQNNGIIITDTLDNDFVSREIIEQKNDIVQDTDNNFAENDELSPDTGGDNFQTENTSVNSTLTPNTVDTQLQGS